MSISSRINEMSTHIEQAYDELQGLGADLTNVNKNIENISMVLDDIYDSMPQVSGEGTSLTLEDTRVGKIKSTLKGNTSQTTYSGKNLLINIRDEGYTVTSNGITFKVNADKSITVSGTATNVASMSLNIGTPVTLSAGTYTLSKKETTDVQVAIWYDSASVWTAVRGNTTTIQKTLSENTTFNNWRTLIVVYQGVTVNTTVYPMLEKSSTETSYEPYVGGTASPNPSYPQDVNVVSGDNEINVCGKNLFDKNSNIVLGQTYSNTGSTADLNNSFVQETYIKVFNSTAYTLSTTNDYSSETDYRLVICEYDENKTFIKRNIYSSGKSLVITTTATTKYVRLCASTITINELQFEKNSSASTYEPYSSNLYPINLPVENLLDKNNVNVLNAFINPTGYVLQANNNMKTLYISCKPNTTYTVSKIQSERFVIGTSTSITIGSSMTNGKNKFTATQLTITSGENDTYLFVFYYNGDADILTPQQILDTIQIEESSKANTYTPYGTTPIELCSSQDGTKRDYLLHDKTLDKWYWHREIGKVVFTGASGENWVFQSGSVWKYRIGINNSLLSTSDTQPPMVLSNYYKAGIWNNSANFQMGSLPSISTTLAIRNDDITSLADWKTWLSTHNTIVYYVLATPTTTEITYQPLIDQLNLLEKAMSKNGQTNISQVNNDLPFIISASALKEWQENTSLNSTLSMVNPLSLGNTLNTQEIENNTQPIEVDNIEPLEEEENEES